MDVEPETDTEMLHVLMSLGMPRARASAVASEIYSPPRITAMARARPSLGVLPGFALDLSTCDEAGQPWNFDCPAQRAKARRLVEDTKPLLLVGSPMCTAFRLLQALNWGRVSPEQKEAIVKRATSHLHFCLELYGLQVREGRCFLHDHPASATSWKDVRM